MRKYTKRITEYIKTVPCNTPIEVSTVYSKQFSDIPETAYYKAIERLMEKDVLRHLTKGVYYRPKCSRFGMIPITDREIADYYTHDNHGVIIGLQLYNNKGITTQIGKNVEILSDNLNGNIKTANNVTIRNANIQFTSKNIPYIETLEILQNYKKLENADNNRLMAYMESFASQYSDKTTNEVLDHRKYKKSTIAFLKQFMDFFNVKNTLDRYLSTMSKYDIPTMEELNETA